MISLENVTLARGAKILLRAASLNIHHGQRVGLVGRNGCGKSSLFALLRGELEADQGQVSLPESEWIASVRQETPALVQSALDYVLDGHQRFRAAEQEALRAQQSGQGLAIAHAHELLQQVDAYRLPARAAELLTGLGFAPAQHQLPVAHFSGGWRMRLNLAQALIAPADLLLLDEPTNHLDLDAIVWLQDFLLTYPATLFIISHDRDFLDALCQHIVHIEGEQLISYRGNYSQFVQTRHEQRLQQDALYAKQAEKRVHLQQFIDRFRAKATKARQAQSRLKALEKLTLTPPSSIEENYALEFPPAEHYPSPVLRLKQAVMGYETPLLKPFTLAINADARIGLLGHNGAGKSTLMKTLAGVLPLLQGERSAHQKAQIGYFAQHQLDRLVSEQTPLWHFQQQQPEASEQELRNFLGAYGFAGEAVQMPVQLCSGGEKARLALALLIATRPNLLLLDEPTNHLDLSMRDHLIRALQTYQGALVLVSHDRSLLRATCDQFYLVDEGVCRVFDGDLDDYRDYLRQKRSEQSSEKTAKINDRQQQKRQEAERRQYLRPYQQSIEKAEKKLDNVHHKQKDLEQALADMSLYTEAEKPRLNALLAEKADADRALLAAEAELMDALEALEAAEKAYKSQY